MNDLMQRLNDAIDIEYDSKMEEHVLMKELPVEELAAKGDCVLNVTAYFVSTPSAGNTIHFKTVKVHCPNNLSKFREGSPVVLAGYGYEYNLDVIEDSDEWMLLEVGWNLESVPQSLNQKNGWILYPQEVDIRHIVKKSLQLLRNDTIKLNYLSGIFSGKIKPEFLQSREIRAKQLAENTRLNDTQKRAFVQAYSTNNYFLIQGPPGSGKTWLLAHLALEFAKEGKKVLITSFTHTAINNALQKISTLSGYPHVIKVGKKSQAENLNYNGSTAINVTDLSRAGYSNNSKGIIVGATCYAPYTKKLEFMSWDVIIIDEAGQVPVQLALPVMVKGEKYIFIGDHKQLPPIISESQNDVDFKRSIFELLFQYTEGIMLDITYRMNKEINSYPSRRFYSGRLKPHSGNENQRLSISNNFSCHGDILDVNKPEVLFCHNQTNNHSRSDYEAEITAEFVNEYIAKGVSPDEIALVTPFRAQVRQMKKALSKYSFWNGYKDRIFIDTVERIQGQERDIVIFSFGVSDPKNVKIRLDFLYNPNRFNVILTRARKKRIVIANNNIFSFKTKDSGMNELIDNYVAFYEDSTVIHEASDTEDLF